MNNDKIITMEKYGDTYKIERRHNYLEMYINNQYQGGINIGRPNIYDWVINNIQSWLDHKSYLEKKYITEDLF
jgi:hypothetical protein